MIMTEYKSILNILLKSVWLAPDYLVETIIPNVTESQSK